MSNKIFAQAVLCVAGLQFVMGAAAQIDPTFSDANWVSMGVSPGTDGDDADARAVQAVAVDGSGNVYVGGDFTLAGGIVANHVAEWNGSRWLPLGEGINGDVLALVVLGTNLYAGGTFTTAGANPATNIALWNGTSWSPLGKGMNGYVAALAVSGGMLYAGGNFTTADTSAVNYIAQWNGSDWSPLGLGMNDDVVALAVSGGTLYAGGYFTNAGGNEANYIAQWSLSASNWSPLGSGLNGYVRALEASDQWLYVGGEFTTAGTNTANYIAQWNGSGWSALGSGVGGGPFGTSYVLALAVSGTNLYAGGYFTNAGGPMANCMAQWNGSSWSPLASGMIGNISGSFPYVYALAVTGGMLYAGGFFTNAGGTTANYIAQWNGGDWSPVGSGLGGAEYQDDFSVNALAVSGTNLYAGGTFTTAGSNEANLVAQWNGSSWSPLEAGMAGTAGMNDGPAFVDALVVSGGTLYAGGAFTTAGGNAANSIAQWNSSSWSPLGSGITGRGAYTFVYALAVSRTNLYAGGAFTTAGGNAANNIAQWNGTGWSSLGSGMNAAVSALATSGGTLYAGGYFTAAGGNAANYIAQWNGTNWSPLGSGIGGITQYGPPPVAALAVSGGTLYVGGTFTTAGGNAANNIAQWNGSSWSPLGLGVGGEVEALAVSGGTLYVGGNFTTAGGNAANNIAQWNGTSWSSLGSGTAGAEGVSVEALALSGGALYAGGNFTTVGSVASSYVAEAIPLLIVMTNGLFGFNNRQFQFSVTGPVGSSAVVQASTDLQTWIPLATNSLNLGSFTFMDILATNFPERFYRAELTP